MPKETFKIEGTGTLDISQIKSSINQIQSTFSKIKLDDNLSKSFKETFNELENQINKFNSKMEQGFQTKGDVTGLEKNVKTINNLLKQLDNNLNEVKKVNLDENIKISSKTLNTLKTLDTQIDNVQQSINTLNASKLQQVVDALGQLKTKGAKTAGQGILEAFNSSDIKKAIELTDELIATQQRYENQVKKSGKSTTNIKANLTALGQLKDVFDDLTSESKKFNDSIDQLNTQKTQLLSSEVTNLKTDFEQAANSAEQLGNAIRQQANASVDAADSQRILNNELDEVRGNLTNFFSLANGIDLFRDAVRSAIDTIKELDATMTEAATVTDFSVADMWDRLPSYSQEASALGAKINDLYAATTLYLQQGLEANEAQAVGIETMKMSRIASMDAAAGTDLMTAALRGFNMELNEVSAQRINDVYSELAAVTAADTAEIGTAMSKTASIASSANMEFEVTAALLSQIIETTREAPETAGTAMKTIIARFTEVKELFDQGLLEGTDSEGQEISINKIDTALQTVGISLKDFLTGARGLDDILLELASKWDGLDLATQRYIATTAAGSRQQSRFLAMMGDYDRTMQLVDAAYNSTGASQEQFEKTLDSLEAKLNQLKNAWDLFTMGIANNQLIKGAIDLLTDFINGINNLADSLGPVGGAITRVIAAFLGFQVVKNVLQNVFSGLVNTFSTSALEKKAARAGMTVAERFNEGLERGFSKTTFDGAIEAKIKMDNINEASNQLKQLIKNADNGIVSLEQFGDRVNYVFSSIKGDSAAIQTLGNSLKTDLLNQLESFNNTADPAFKQLKQTIESLANASSLDEIKQKIQQINQEVAQLNKTSGANLNLKIDSKSVKTINKDFSDLTTKTAQAASGISDFGSLLSHFGGAVGKVGLQITGLGSIFMDLVGVVGTVKGLFDGLAASSAVTLASITSLLGPIIAVAAALAAVAAIGFASWYFSEGETLKRQLKEAQELTEATASAAEDAQAAYDEVISAFDSYHTARDALSDLTEGTYEWKEALLEVNSQVLDLIAKYPELAQYVTRGENGNLEISEEGENQLIERQQRSVAATTTANLSAQVSEKQAQQDQTYYDLQQLINKNSYAGIAANSKEVLDLYNTNPDAFVANKTFNASNLSSATDEELIGLFKQYVVPMAGASGLEEYLKYDAQTNSYDVKEGYEKEVADALRDSNSNAGNYLAYTAGYQDLTLYSDELFKLADGMVSNAQGLINIAPQLGEFSAATLEAESTIDGLIDTMLSTNVDSNVLNDEFGDSLTDAYSDIVKESMRTDVSDLAQQLKDENDLGQLQDMYADVFEIPKDQINENIREDEEALANAIASFQISESYATKIEEIFDTISKATDQSAKTAAQNMFTAISGNFEQMSEESKQALMDLDTSDADALFEYVSNIMSSLGYTINDSGIIEELGISLEDLTNHFGNAIDRLRQEEVSVNDALGLQIAKNGTFRQTNNSQDVLSDLIQLDTQQKSNIASLAEQIRAGLGGASSSNFMEGAIEIYADGTKAAQEAMEGIFLDVDFSNPIQAFGALQEAIQSTESDVSALGQSMLITSGDAVSTASQFQYFLKSADFSEMNDQLEDFVEENGKITPDNVEELANSCSSLKQMLDQTGISASTAAGIINGIYVGDLGIDDLTDSLIIALSAFGKFDSVVDNAFNTIENFDPGRDTGEIGDWVNEAADTVIEMYDNGEYGNEQLQNYLKLLFGEDQWDAALLAADGKLDQVEGQFVDRLRILEGNLYGAWHELASSEQYQTQLSEYNAAQGTNIQISELSDGSIELLTNGATTDQVVQGLMEAYNISKEYAEMLLTDFYNFSGDLKTELAANDWAAGISDYVKAREVTTMSTNAKGQTSQVTTPVFSDKEIRTIAAQTGQTEFDIWSDIANELGVVTTGLTSVSQIQSAIGEKGKVIKLLDSEGNLLEIGAIKEQLNTTFGSESMNGLWIGAFAGLREEGTIALEDIQATLSSLGLDDATIAKLTGEAVQAMRASGDDTTITVNGVEISEEEEASLSTSMQTTLENGAENADMSILGDTISEAITSGITGTDDSTWFSGLSTAAQTNIESAYTIISGKSEEIASAVSEDTEAMSSSYADATQSMSDSMSTAAGLINGSLTSISDQATTSKGSVDNLQTSISNLTGKTVTVKANLSTNYSGFRLAGNTFSVEWFASGSTGLKKDTLGVVGDGGGPELILSKDGNVRLGGVGGAELTQLEKGDQIYTAKETKDLLGGKTNVDIPKFATGYRKPNSQTQTGWSGSSSSSSSSSSGSSYTPPSSSSSSASSVAEEEEEIWENTFDWLYNLTEKISEALREQTRIERQYNKILKDRFGTSADLLQNVYDQIAALEYQAELEKEMIERRTEEMNKLMKDNSDLNKYAIYNWDAQTIEINWDEIDKVTDVDLGERIEDYISELEEIQDELDQANDSLFDIEDSLEDLEDIGKEDFFDFENRVMDALVNYYQEQIDELSLIDESINDTNSKLINSIQNSVNQMRQQRENERTEEELAEKERRLAYLRQDTSGANQLEIKQLEEELAQGQESYTDSLVDQKIQELQDQNDYAAEQRQLQIELAQAALDTAQQNGDLWKNVQELIKSGTDSLGKLITGSQLDQILKRAESWEALSNMQKMEWLKGIEQALKVSGQYYEKETDDVYGVSYDPNADYTALILDMLASGNIDYHQLAVWEQQRNAKIINEGLDYPLRFEYIDYLDDFDPNVDYMQRIMDYLAEGDYLMAAISQYQRNRKIKELGLDYDLEYDLYPYLFLNDGNNPFLDYRDYVVDYEGYRPEKPYTLDTYSSGYNLRTSVMPTYGTETYYQNSGDNYYEVHIQVDSLSNDYDVDQLARKVEQQINENARYRNVNAINRLR